MINIVIAAIFIIAIVGAAYGSYVHFKGNGSCCGGGSSSVALEKHLDGNIVYKKNVKIQGMVCENCKAHVQNALNEINGLSATVNLKKASAKVDAVREISEDEIRNAVNKAGNYNVVSIEDR